MDPQSKAVAAVNQHRDKTACLREMTLIIDDRTAAPLVDGLRRVLTPLRVALEPRRDLRPGLLRWRRSTDRVWSEPDAAWRPLRHPHVRDEAWIVVVMTTREWVQHLTDAGRRAAFLDALETAYPRQMGHRYMLVFEKMATYLNGRANAMARAVALEARTPGQPPTFWPTSGELDALLFDLQMTPGVHLQKSLDVEDTCQWIQTFTTQIAMDPEISRRLQSKLELGVGDTVKTAATEEETWPLMLMQIYGITQTCADAIVRAYPTLHRLMTVYSQLPETDAVHLLDDLEIDLGAGHHPRTRRMGEALSSRVYQALVLKDPEHVIMPVGLENGAPSG
ncbi:hypothetical protein CXG81DRAFT_26021 [Caulochytrium protostelioides]|uniref:ERCC4 domain-containing protein n=1 Tax=Caulochytrium protostelioides TaxID=1555241 RepID=A0A4P9X7S2_9FUNG|nr:hypothetical protein CXG81DRAFT_26021 [Caulochytrium protostelioides]|eukprot:RKP01307.1 hypothetical protein CXG81DRAFT_26021 [Caulochytrium protostelioides]